MPNLFHLTLVAILMATFSGMPAPVKKNPSLLSIVPTARPVHSIAEDAEFIPWQSERRLAWEDFQCSPRRNTDAVASTSTSLGIAYQLQNGVIDYQITCNFSKQKSWGLIRTDYILAHEQAHFDITEIYARKLHQALEDYHFNRKTYQRDINRIYNEIVAGKEAMQQAYDGQSDHSRNRKIQLEWLTRINQLLEETAPYAAYP